jgi:mono/diheme cytochrome c family protein
MSFDPGSSEVCLKKKFLTGVSLALFIACGDEEKPAPFVPEPGERGGSSATGGQPSPATGGASGATSDAGEGGAPESGQGGSTPVPPFAGTSGSGDPEDQIEYGRYLVDNVIACPDCHTPRTAEGAPDLDNYMAGVECFVELESGECLHTPNLTSDETGLSNRTDDDLKLMIMEGLRPTDGADYQPLNPIMPYYVFHNMELRELNAIVAYLRTIPAVEHEVPPSDEAFQVTATVNPLDPYTIPMPDEDYPEYESAVRGRYLATHVGLCIECHTPREMGSPDLLDPEKFFIGGERFPIGLPVVPIAKNLTSDTETGLGNWKAEDIVTALKDGVDAYGDGLCPPMPGGPMAAYGGLSDDDALDIANYIKSLPAKENQIEDECISQL